MLVHPSGIAGRPGKSHGDHHEGGGGIGIVGFWIRLAVESQHGRKTVLYSAFLFQRTVQAGTRDANGYGKFPEHVVQRRFVQRDLWGQQDPPDRP